MMEDITISGSQAEVKVHDPQHQGEGRSKFTSYLVEVKAPSLSVCRRRYSDFQWLYEKLLEERAGCIIPIILHTRALTPGKRFSEELVNGRMVQLNWFLSKVMNHHDLVDSPSLQTFLTVNQTEWDGIKGTKSFDDGASEAGFPEPGSEKEKPAGVIAKMMNKVRTKIAMVGNTKLESTPDDDIFNDIEAYVSNLEANIKVLHKGSETLVKSMKQSSDTLKQMGASFALMGQYTLANDVVVRTPSYTMTSRLASNWNNLSKLISFQQSSTKGKLEVPLEEMMRDVAAARISLTKRKELLYNYTLKVNIGNKKQGQLDKLREQSGMPDSKSINLEGEIRMLKQENSELWKEFDEVSRRLSRDVERFKAEIREKLRATMENFHTVQEEYSKKYVQGWSEVMPVLTLGEKSKKTKNGTKNEAPPGDAFPAPADAPPAVPSEDGDAPITTSV
eukprot:CAMPEP_0194129152 /NCGR_PEP_ID=MMETSP0152-20130528/393_1 /TAXON_ID=1049557 /ORGANISM="Thalassiothrix antarctica, Strain L6-D1" /LENGTH=447 /DNA_ID=CAMNT_0038823255 /DNA_START=104 /DNA_END=1447 /DNA_ORIENTATION=+